jgi:hypothetical protein
MVVLNFNITEFVEDLVATGLTREEAFRLAREEMQRRKDTTRRSNLKRVAERAKLGSSARPL